MPDRVWYRSLYWRIALGFILTVAALLVAQASLFVWLAGRASSAENLRSPAHLASIAASNLAEALEADPKADLERTLRAEFGNSPHRMLVILRDGRVLRNRDFPYPEMLVRATLARIHRDSSNVSVTPVQPDSTARPREPGSDDDAPRGRRARFPPLGPIVVDGTMVGAVVVISGPPRGSLVLYEYGPTLAIAGAVLLVIGTATMAFFVFAPARRRLRALEQAAQALGAGTTGARAPESGGDEVAALARSFNRMASDLEARVQELQELDRARRQLLADVSHELMTPLTAMRGYLETLALPEAVPDSATRERYLHIVTEETLRLESIIGDLLDLARLEGGGGDLHWTSVPVAALFERAAARHDHTLRDKSITLETRIAPDAEVVRGDPRRLEQAIQNLVANAVRHTPVGGEIKLAAERRDGRVALRVDDSGPGIPPEHLPHVFDRFYRVDAARDQATGGSGLGLSIVRAIVERHGGGVEVSSPSGRGASFAITLDPSP